MSAEQQKQPLAAKNSSISLSIEEAFKIFKGMLPKNLLKQGTSLLELNDIEQFKTFVQTHIQPIIADYQKKMINPSLNEGEELLWTHTLERGVIHKEKVALWGITNLRAFKLFYVTKDNPKEYITSVGLAVSDTVVMNQHRESRGTRVGTFAGGSRGAFAGVGVGISQSRSHTVGDLVFLLAGKEVIRFSQITDPNGVDRMVKTVKKHAMPT